MKSALLDIEGKVAGEYCGHRLESQSQQNAHI